MSKPRRYTNASMIRVASALVLALSLIGCRTLVPYDSQFSCEKNQDFGKCIDVGGAYEEALGAQPAAEAKDRAGATAPKWEYPSKGAPKRATSERTRRTPNKQVTANAGRLVRVGFDPSNAAELYRDAQFRELSGLIENPVTPLVTPPKVLRTLIVSYSAGDSLYMPRFVYYIAEESRFVIGDYLKGAPPPAMVYPNGTPIAQQSSR